MLFADRRIKLKLYILVVASLALTGCMTNTKSGDTGISAGTVSEKSGENKVFFNKNSFMTSMDTYEIALKHCSKFGKTPKLVREASALDFWMQDEYDCIKK